MKITIGLPVLCMLCFLACMGQEKTVNRLNGFWIPESIDWKEGSFETFCFLDSGFMKIASSQVRVAKDSISYFSEPGFIVNAGSFQTHENYITISHRVLYRFIGIVGENLPGDLITDTLWLKNKKDHTVSFSYQLTKYVQTSKINFESRERLKSIATHYLANP